MGSASCAYLMPLCRNLSILGLKLMGTFNQPAAHENLKNVVLRYLVKQKRYSFFSRIISFEKC